MAWQIFLLLNYRVGYGRTFTKHNLFYTIASCGWAPSLTSVGSSIDK